MLELERVCPQSRFTKSHLSHTLFCVLHVFCSIDCFIILRINSYNKTLMCILFRCAYKNILLSNVECVTRMCNHTEQTVMRSRSCPKFINKRWREEEEKNLSNNLLSNNFLFVPHQNWAMHSFRIFSDHIHLSRAPFYDYHISIKIDISYLSRWVLRD